MAEVPSDIRWPPGEATDYDSLFDDAMRLKEFLFPEHTARDLADPYIQLMSLMVALQVHTLAKVSHALKQLAPRTATSRRALIALLEVSNRPLRAMQPARGPAYARLKSRSHSSGDTLVESGQRVAQPSSNDPVYTVDEAVLAPSSFVPTVTHYDDSAGTSTVLTAPWSISLGTDDYLLVELDTLAFDTITFDLSTPMASQGLLLSLEHYNEESYQVDSVSNLGATLRFVLDSYLFKGETLGAPLRLMVTVTYRPTGVSETVEVTTTIGLLVAVTTFLGQVSPSVAPSDYEVTSEWRPVRNAADTTNDNGALRGDGDVSFSISDVLATTALWARNPSGKYAARLRVINVGSNADPSTLAATSVTLGGNLWCVVALTQGVRTAVAVGQTDGQPFQHMPVPTPPIEEPVADPKFALVVAGDADWAVADTLSDSDSTSRHALFVEDADEGWGLLFGDGALGQLPSDGSSVRLTYRTGSTQPGDLAAGAAVRPVGGLGRADEWTLFRGTDGYQPAEASDRESALRYRHRVLPELSLRAESAITPPEICTALSGGAPNRATFETSDGRRPFSRAFYSLEGAGARQYRVLVVGSESDDLGSADSADLDEAEEWLNGVEVGIQIIGGHGPNNTQGIVTQFTPRPLLPTVTVTISNPAGVRDTVDRIVKAFFRPHSRDEDTQEFRWEVGGKVPLAILFGLLWDALPGRVLIVISVDDGSTTYDVGDYVQLLGTELPTLDSGYAKATNVVVVAP